MYFGKTHDKIINERISCYFREIFLWDSSFLCYGDEENASIYAVHLTSLKFIDRIKVLWQNNGMEVKTILERCKMRNVTGAEEQ